MKFALAFIPLAMIAGALGTVILNRGENTGLALATLIDSHREDGVEDAKIVKVRRVALATSVVRQYTIEFRNSDGEKEEAEIRCEEVGGRNSCLENKP